MIFQTLNQLKPIFSYLLVGALVLGAPAVRSATCVAQPKENYKAQEPHRTVEEFKAYVRFILAQHLPSPDGRTIKIHPFLDKESGRQRTEKTFSAAHTYIKAVEGMARQFSDLYKIRVILNKPIRIIKEPFPSFTIEFFEPGTDYLISRLSINPRDLSFNRNGYAFHQWGKTHFQMTLKGGRSSGAAILRSASIAEVDGRKLSRSSQSTKNARPVDVTLSEFVLALAALPYLGKKQDNLVLLGSQHGDFPQNLLSAILFDSNGKAKTAYRFLVAQLGIPLQDFIANTYRDLYAKYPAPRHHSMADLFERLHRIYRFDYDRTQRQDQLMSLALQTLIEIDGSPLPIQPVILNLHGSANPPLQFVTLPANFLAPIVLDRSGLWIPTALGYEKRPPPHGLGAQLSKLSGHWTFDSETTVIQQWLGLDGFETWKAPITKLFNSRQNINRGDLLAVSRPGLTTVVPKFVPKVLHNSQQSELTRWIVNWRQTEFMDNYLQAISDMFASLRRQLTKVEEQKVLKGWETLANQQMKSEVSAEFLFSKLIVPYEAFRTGKIDWVTFLKTFRDLILTRSKSDRSLANPVSESFVAAAVATKEYRTTQEIEAEFEFLTRKTNRTDASVVHESDIALNPMFKGVPDKVIEVVSQEWASAYVRNTELVYAVGSAGALKFDGFRSSLGSEIRYYGLLLPKGFLAKFAVDLGKLSPIKSFSALQIEQELDNSKVFFLKHERATEEHGQLHVFLDSSITMADGSIKSQAEFLRRYVLGVAEFSESGSVIRLVWF